jgi:hypothetical protein
MLRYLSHAVVLGATAFSFAQPIAGTPVEPAPGQSRQEFDVRSANLHRVKGLFTEDTRAIWVGDSWSLMHNTTRLPFGSLMVWPIERLAAVGAGYQVWGPASGTNYTFGPGQLEFLESANGWVAETNDGTPARIALPVNSITRVFGEVDLVLDADWAGPPRVQALGIRNGLIALGDLPLFAGVGDHVSVRPLYYAPLELPDLVAAVGWHDQDAAFIANDSLRANARPFWHLGEDPEAGPPRAPAASQINAFAHDLPLATGQGAGPKLVITEDPANPLVGSGDYWCFAGGVFYLTDEAGARTPGYYHAGLASSSWQFSGFATNAQSNGNKRFTDEQLTHWLDVTTLDRSQQPVVILHIATEELSEISVIGRTEAILERFRAAFERIGTVPPKFLLVGSFMHRVGVVHVATDRIFVEALNRAFLTIAQSSDDCAFVSLYAMTDGTYFTNDVRGGAGTQQAARDWLDANGWSTIAYGGTTYNLSSAEDGGLDGELSSDGLHIDATPSAAFFAKLMGDEIEASVCPGDTDLDGDVDTRDFIVFLGIWAAGDPEADLDGDGDVDTRDFILFLDAWAQGC